VVPPIAEGHFDSFAGPRALIRAAKTGALMPRELKSRDEFDKLLESATEIRVSRKDESAKIKLRTKRALYTFKTTTEEADAITKATKTPVVEH
jgi:Ribosomal L38e protein family